jgi:phospholipase/carboxylesterase
MRDSAGCGPPCPWMSRRRFLAAAASFTSAACAMSGRSSSAADPAHIEVRPVSPRVGLAPGEHRLGLDDVRDGVIYVPRVGRPGSVRPLAMMLHGAGGNGSRMRFSFALAEEFGVAVLAPDSRGGTWDFVRGGFGPDVAFIGAALQHVFERIAVDPTHLAIGGFSDGASYALSLALANGRLFTHVLAFSPGFIVRTRSRGRPRIFLCHGTADQVLPINQTSRRIVADLQDYGYPVRYREFSGPHTVPPDLAREAFAWFTR